MKKKAFYKLIFRVLIMSITFVLVTYLTDYLNEIGWFGDCIEYSKWRNKETPGWGHRHYIYTGFLSFLGLAYCFKIMYEFGNEFTSTTEHERLTARLVKNEEILEFSNDKEAKEAGLVAGCLYKTENATGNFTIYIVAND